MITHSPKQLYAVHTSVCIEIKCLRYAYCFCENDTYDKEKRIIVTDVLLLEVYQYL